MRSASQNTTPGYQIELIDKVVRLLEVLRERPAGVTLQELAARTGFVKSSIHRVMQSLKRHGYIEQAVSGGPYRLGVPFLLLARGMQEGIGLIAFARASLRELADAFDESTYLAILRGGHGIFVDVAETRRRELRLVGPVGAAVHYHATAAGKALAANLPAVARGALLARTAFEKFTAHTRTRRVDVDREWAQVARRGYATNDEETIVGARFLAAPVFDAERAVCSAISIGFPTARYTAPIGRRAAALLVQTCRRLSETLASAGYVHEDRQLHEGR